MSRDPSERTPAETADLERSTRLLRLGLTGAERPVDELVLALERRDGPEWLAGVVATSEADALRRLAAGDAPERAELESLKDAAKRALEAAKDRDARLGAVFAYFAAIAAARVQHGAVISSHPAGELAAAFLELAAAAPPPWDAMFTAAWSGCSP